ncbi:MAG: CocE/NonD family hydrolase [Thermoleophilaceae bacterium]
MLAPVPADVVQESSAQGEPSFTTRVRAPDGVELATDVYLPARSAPGGAPAVLMRTPYGRGGEIDAVADTARLLGECGIAVVGQDVRGKFDSGGERQPFLHEVADGHATAEWISGQPWSNGAVVPLGASYTGFAAWAVAASGHPAVRGAVVRMTTCHIPDEWLYRQGLFRLQMNAPWALFAWSGPELNEGEPDWAVRPLSAALPDPAAGEHLRHWLANPPESPWWDRHGLGSASPLSGRVRVPVLHWGGWWDLLSRGQIREWDVLGRAGAPDQRLVMGATDHDFHPFVDVMAGVTRPAGARRAPVEAELAPAMDFLTAVCAGGRPGNGAVRFELTHAGWREDAGWPPAGCHPVRLYLADGAHAGYGPEGGSLTHHPDGVPATVRWSQDPADLVPSLETFVWGTLANDYPDERDAQVRDDVVTFTGQPATEPLDVVGPLRLRLAVQASSGRAQLAATVCDVMPDGRALRIAEGGCLVRDARERQTVDVDLGPAAYRLREGHRLRVAVAASSFPRYLWYPGDGLDPWTALNGPPVERSLELGDASHLEVRVLD